MILHNGFNRLNLYLMRSRMKRPRILIILNFKIQNFLNVIETIKSMRKEPKNEFGLKLVELGTNGK